MSETDGIPGQVFASVWDALEDSPAEAANMRMRSDSDSTREAGDQQSANASRQPFSRDWLVPRVIFPVRALPSPRASSCRRDLCLQLHFYATR